MIARDARATGLQPSGRHLPTRWCAGGSGLGERAPPGAGPHRGDGVGQAPPPRTGRSTRPIQGVRRGSPQHQLEPPRDEPGTRQRHLFTSRATRLRPAVISHGWRGVLAATITPGRMTGKHPWNRGWHRACTTVPGAPHVLHSPLVLRQGVAQAGCATLRVIAVAEPACAHRLRAACGKVPDLRLRSGRGTYEPRGKGHKGGWHHWSFGPSLRSAPRCASGQWWPAQPAAPRVRCARPHPQGAASSPTGARDVHAPTLLVDGDATVSRARR